MAYLTPFYDDDPLTRQRRVTSKSPTELVAPVLQRPRTVIPGAQSDQQDPIYNDKTKRWEGVQPPVPQAIPQQSAPQQAGQRQPTEPSVPQTDLSLPAPPTDVQSPVTDAASNPPFYRQSVKSSTDTSGLNNVGKRLAIIEALKKAGADQRVFTGQEGSVETEYPHKLSRWKEALHGILQGALAGAATGGWRGAIGGAATGGIAGAVNPKLIAALERQQEIDRQQRSVTQDIGNQKEVAQLGDITAQTAQRQAESERLRRGTPHYERDQNGNLQAVYDTGAYPVTDVTTGEQVGKDTTESEAQRKSREATEDYHTKLIQQRVLDRQQRDRALQQRLAASRAAGKKTDPALQGAHEAYIESVAEQNHLAMRAKSDAQIVALEKERESLTSGTAAYRPENKARLVEIDRQLADFRKESDYRQKEADDAASRKRIAEAKARAGGYQVDWNGGEPKGGPPESTAPAKQGKPPAGAGFGKTWSRSKWLAANPDKADRADEAEAAAKAAGRRVVP